MILPPRPSSPRRGFTLIELLIVMGVIGVLSVLTLVSVKAITADARLSSATNTVTAALANARAIAMKKNSIVLVVFRPQFEGNARQRVELVTAKWTGDSYLTFGSGGANPTVIDRFVPITDVPFRNLPVGVKVAGPLYADNEDDTWVTQTHLPAVNQVTGAGEVPGRMIGVMYGPDGTTLSRNSQSDSDQTWVDFVAIFDAGEPKVRADNNQFSPSARSMEFFFEQKIADDETFVTVAPFLAVYDDTQARELKSLDWDNSPQGRQNYEDELTGLSGYITRNADRIHFNRYTGVVMK